MCPRGRPRGQERPRGLHLWFEHSQFKNLLTMTLVLAFLKIYDEMDIHSYDTSIHRIMLYACLSWAGGLNKKCLAKKLRKIQRLACLMISSAFPGTYWCSGNIAQHNFH